MLKYLLSMKVNKNKQIGWVMKRKSKNVIIPKGGIPEIERLYKEEKNSTVKERLQIIYWAAKKESNAEIARRLNKIDNTIGRWITRWNKSGYEGLIDKPRSGRPSVLNPNEKKQVLAKVNNHKDNTRITCKILCIQIREDFNKELTDEAIRKFLHKHNLSWKKPKKVDYRQNEDPKREFIDALKKRLQNSRKIQSFGI